MILSSCRCIVAVIALFLIACGAANSQTLNTPSTVVQPAKILKVAVAQDGSITADGVPTSLDALDAALGSLATDKGAA